MSNKSTHITAFSAANTFSSIFLATILFFFEHKQFSTYSFNTYVFNLGLALTISCFSVLPFLFTYHWPFAMLTTLTLQGGALIIIFAAIYRGHGLEAITGDDIITYTPSGLENNIITYTPAAPETAIYFSIVTWTTLGYGDIKPPEELRIVAATEALLGYMYLGLFVTMMGAMFLRKSSRPN